MAKEAKLCEVPGCSYKHNARGYCKTHYKIFITQKGEIKQPYNPIDPEELWNFVKKELNLA